MTDRGISDLVGFVLMFGIIIMSVAIVTTAGLGQLSELSEREGINSAERGMEAFAGSVDDLTRHGDLFRQALLSPSGGLVWLNQSSMGLEVYNSTQSDPLVLDKTGAANSVGVNALEHRFSRNPEDVSVSYESGSVFRSDGGGAIVRPQWKCGDETAFVTAVRLAPGGDLSLGSGFGSDTGDVSPTSGDEMLSGDIESTDEAVRFQLTRTNTETHTFENENGNSLTVRVNADETATPEQWQFYFERADGWSSTGSGWYDCENKQRVVVRIVTVELTA